MQSEFRAASHSVCAQAQRRCANADTSRISVATATFIGVHTCKGKFNYCNIMFLPAGGKLPHVFLRFSISLIFASRMWGRERANDVL